MPGYLRGCAVMSKADVRTARRKRWGKDWYKVHPVIKKARMSWAAGGDREGRLGGATCRSDGNVHSCKVRLVRACAAAPASLAEALGRPGSLLSQTVFESAVGGHRGRHRAPHGPLGRRRLHRPASARARHRFSRRLRLILPPPSGLAARHRCPAASDMRGFTRFDGLLTTS